MESPDVPAEATRRGFFVAVGGPPFERSRDTILVRAAPNPPETGPATAKTPDYR
jgi:hypothetical protein